MEASDDRSRVEEIGSARAGAGTKVESPVNVLIPGERLHPERCRALFRLSARGRLGILAERLPVTTPAVYLVDGDSFLVGLDAAGLAGLAPDTLVALHADGVCADSGGRWAVLAVGRLTTSCGAHPARPAACRAAHPLWEMPQRFRLLPEALSGRWTSDEP